MFSVDAALMLCRRSPIRSWRPWAACVATAACAVLAFADAVFAMPVSRAPTVGGLAGRGACYVASDSSAAMLRQCTVSRRAISGSVEDVVMGADGRDVFVLTDNGEVGVLRRDARTGRLSDLTCVDAVPVGFRTPCLFPGVVGSGVLYTPRYPRSEYYQAKGLWASGDGRWLAIAWRPDELYAPADAPGVITLLARDAVTGVLSEAACITRTGAGGCVAAPALRNWVTAVVFGGSGEDVFVLSGVSHDVPGVESVHPRFSGVAVTWLAHDASTGGLRHRACAAWTRSAGPCVRIPGPAAPHGMVADGVQRLWLFSARGHMRVLRPDPTRATIDQIACFEEPRRSACTQLAGLRGAQGLAVSPDSRHLYVQSYRPQQRGRGETRLSWWALARDTRLSAGGCLSDRPTRRCHRGFGADPFLSGDLSFKADGSELASGGYGPFGRYGYVALLGRSTGSGDLRVAGCIASRPQPGCAYLPQMRDGEQVAFAPDGRNLYVGQSAYFALVALGRGVGIAPRASWRPSARMVTLRLACPSARTEGCHGTLAARGTTSDGSGRVGATTFSVPPGRTIRVQMRIRRHARLGHRRLRLEVTATDAGRLVRSARSTVRLRVRRR